LLVLHLKKIQSNFGTGDVAILTTRILISFVDLILSEVFPTQNIKRRIFAALVRKGN
jgi:hypothetical protein